MSASVRPGQVWQEKGARAMARRIVVLEVDEDFARVDSGKAKTRIALDNLPRRYRLVGTAPVEREK